MQDWIFRVSWQHRRIYVKAKAALVVVFVFGVVVGVVSSLAQPVEAQNLYPFICTGSSCQMVECREDSQCRAGESCNLFSHTCESEYDVFDDGWREVSLEPEVELAKDPGYGTTLVEVTVTFMNENPDQFRDMFMTTVITAGVVSVPLLIFLIFLLGAAISSFSAMTSMYMKGTLEAFRLLPLPFQSPKGKQKSRKGKKTTN